MRSDFRVEKIGNKSPERNLQHIKWFTYHKHHLKICNKTIDLFFMSLSNIVSIFDLILEIAGYLMHVTD